MNGGTNRGGAYGFRLSALEKLSTVKSVDNKCTLAEYIVGSLSVSNPDALLFTDDLQHAQEAAGIPLPQLRTEIASLGKVVRDVISEVDWVASHQDDEAAAAVAAGGGVGAGTKGGHGGALPPPDLFVEKIKPFAEDAASKSRVLLDRMAAVEGAFQEVAHNFGEIPSKTDSGAFFASLDAFAATVKRAQAALG